MKKFMDMAKEILNEAETDVAPVEVDDTEKKEQVTDTDVDKKEEEQEDKKDENKNPENDKKDKEDEDKEKKEAPKKKRSDRSMTPTQIKEVRNKFIETFNAENEGKTKIKLEAYEPFSEYLRSFKITLEVDPEEIYLERNKYEEGDAWIELNEIFFKDAKSIATRLGIYDIEWKNDDDLRYGTIRIDAKKVDTSEN